VWPDVLKEDKHDDEDQENRHDQGMHNLFDRDFDKGSGV